MFGQEEECGNREKPCANNTRSAAPESRSRVVAQDAPPVLQRTRRDLKESALRSSCTATRTRPRCTSPTRNSPPAPKRSAASYPTGTRAARLLTLHVGRAKMAEGRTRAHKE